MCASCAIDLSPELRFVSFKTYRIDTNKKTCFLKHFSHTLYKFQKNIYEQSFKVPFQLEIQSRFITKVVYPTHILVLATIYFFNIFAYNF